ncbi:ABC transporter permease (plasmid) [Clostridium estertheticum]|uniref:ABC transporter permease n=1 Tax=Clostridium estertheticum TaxID=238834 RepID=UPI001C0C51D7|nr:ABC transporter permease [Clostridium estertheticum]MBU3218323.1 ABC transporter permease [Clostridium estertheticum]WAG58256.1 ABC transporter permease [Clostridium estertheticum]
MLDLIICEFAKIKRQRFILFSMLAACLFPIPMTVLVAKDRLNFEQLFRLVVMFGHFLLLPCVLSVVASILFFMERDSDMLKNLITIPVNKTKLVVAKLTVLLIVAVLYSIAGLGATIIGGLIVGTVEGIAFKLGLSVVLGIMFFVSVLPVIILIVYFNKSYILSTIIAFIYSIFNFIIQLSMMNFAPNSVLITVLPASVIMRWWMSFWSGLTAENAIIRKPYMLSTPVCAGILCLIAVISILMISIIYKKQED